MRVLFCCATLVLWSENHIAAKPPRPNLVVPAGKGKHSVNNHTTISSIGPGSITVSEAGHPKTVFVSPFTEILLNGQKAGMNDLKSGMPVSVTLDDPTHASRIEASNAH